MTIGYGFFLRKIAAMLDSKENVTTSGIAACLNLGQDEFKELLSLMQKRGDIEVMLVDKGTCGGNCTGCRSSCTTPSRPAQNIVCYRLTEKGRAACHQ